MSQSPDARPEAFLGYHDAEEFSRGDVAPWVFVLDNFYADPEAVRRHALRQSYATVADSQFPGMRSEQAAPSHMLDFFEKLVGRRPYRVGSSFQYLRAVDANASFVHGDPNDYAAIVYLNPDADGRPGTAIYRHKETGLCRLPDTFDLLRVSRRLGVEPASISKRLNDDRFDLDRWEQLSLVPTCFNRLVAYDAATFHCNASAWGETVEDSRLAQQFFALMEASTTPDAHRVRVTGRAFGSPDNPRNPVGQ